MGQGPLPPGLRSAGQEGPADERAVPLPIQNQSHFQGVIMYQKNLL